LGNKNSMLKFVDVNIIANEWNIRLVLIYLHHKLLF
jgi:hypothetical protein